MPSNLELDGSVNAKVNGITVGNTKLHIEQEYVLLYLHQAFNWFLCISELHQLQTISKEAVGGEGLVLLYSQITNTKTIVTGAGDETPRFWNVFPSPKSQWLKALLKD
ncbi:uncharacterized protein LOC121049634 [Rosa chinensis]|uniref:uncharacterized protein LOC121049634 n=1 Tax=Rosa chinensis TaxID=74649 RepID=UPI001AD94F85|nr:uncharacterized protein LOC121049634 [Rosa chinensis]